MSRLHLANQRGRDATVAARSLAGTRVIRWIDDAGAAAATCRLLRGSYDQSLDALRQRFGDDPEAIARALVEGDPEVDLERFGSVLRHPVRVYVGPDHDLVHRVMFEEVIRDPDGTERTRRTRQVSEPNVASGLPLRWTGKRFPKTEIYNRFVFSSKLQVVHVNGLTYDFLFDIARQLESEACLMRVGGGSKGTEPLIFRRGGLPYHGFLEGRTDGKRYALILHLTNLELKRPAPPAAAPPPSEVAPEPEPPLAAAEPPPPPSTAKVARKRAAKRPRSKP